MNGGLWRRVEASITRGNNAMTNQRDSGMTIALERIQYWEIELIDGGPADTRETRTLLNIREIVISPTSKYCQMLVFPRFMRFLIDRETIIILSNKI